MLLQPRSQSPVSPPCSWDCAKRNSPPFLHTEVERNQSGWVREQNLRVNPFLVGVLLLPPHHACCHSQVHLCFLQFLDLVLNVIKHCLKFSCAVYEHSSAYELHHLHPRVQVSGVSLFCVLFNLIKSCKSFCTVQRRVLSVCFSSCTVVNCILPLSSNFDSECSILRGSPAQISRYFKIVFILIFNCGTFEVQISNEFHSCVSRWALVPEHHPVVSFIMAA